MAELENLLVDDEFVDLQNHFLRKHCQDFDESTEENKLIYTDLFTQYVRRNRSTLTRRFKLTK